ncbi:hypothetical protein HDV05_004961 [Chytridiales sp. JEL 0842]|nr:hypothetical protein HDV05_004961 [Chytridiales sp. JEL 0842]
MVVTTNVRNDNYFPLIYEQVTVKISSQKYDNGQTPIGTAVVGQLQSTSTIGARSTAEVPVPFSLTYDAAKDSNREFISFVLARCAAAAFGSKEATAKLAFDVEVNLTYRVLGGNFNAPTFQNNYEFVCPFSIPAGGITGLTFGG